MERTNDDEARLATEHAREAHRIANKILPQLVGHNFRSIVGALGMMLANLSAVRPKGDLEEDLEFFEIIARHHHAEHSVEIQARAAEAMANLPTGRKA